jgi:hypothetical protein
MTNQLAPKSKHRAAKYTAVPTLLCTNQKGEANYRKLTYNEF